MWLFSCKNPNVLSDFKILDSFYFLKSENLQLAFHAKNTDCAYLYKHTHLYIQSLHADARNVHEDV